MTYEPSRTFFSCNSTSTDGSATHRHVGNPRGVGEALCPLQVENREGLYDKLGIDGIFSIPPPYIGSPLHEEENYSENV